MVAFYRKYIDIEREVTDEDMQHLYELGNRCGFTTEYYKKHNDKSMITFEKPSYEKSNEALHKQIERDYVNQKSQIPIAGTVLIHKGQALEFYANAGDDHVYVSLGEVQEAKNKPLEKTDVYERMNKTGETPFYFSDLTIHMDSDVFVPNGMLNQLRRDVLHALEEKLLGAFRRDVVNEHVEDSQKMQEVLGEMKTDTFVKEMNGEKCICACETRGQFEIILKHAFVTTIYVDSSMYMHDREKFVSQLEFDVSRAKEMGKEVFLRLPVIFRAHTARFFEEVKFGINKIGLMGVVVRNYEELYFAKIQLPGLQVVIDHNLYTYNDFAKDAFGEYDILRDTVPLELNQKEIRRRDNIGSEMLVYGYYPLMTTAGCVHKNTLSCDKKSGITYLKDRYQVLFPVKNYCTDCYNVIYNSVPTLLFGEVERLRQYGIAHMRMDFTIETEKEVENVLRLYEGNGREIDYTNGHYKRGVE